MEAKKIKFLSSHQKLRLRIALRRKIAFIISHVDPLIVKEQSKTSPSDTWPDSSFFVFVAL
ncbi:hypothetical protein MYX78_11565, partial [Acidobacteria bacterium AH-259-G07]|nr:hypothetical protein [Acidobacteria bacterium AH-259-G07]